MHENCFELKGSLFTLTVLQLFDNDLNELKSQLTRRIEMAPGFFNHTPVVVDLYHLNESRQKMDFFELRELLLSLSLIPVGVKGSCKALRNEIEAAGLATLAEAKHSGGKTCSENTKQDENQEQKQDLHLTDKAAEAPLEVFKLSDESELNKKPDISESIHKADTQTNKEHVVASTGDNSLYQENLDLDGKDSDTLTENKIKEKVQDKVLKADESLPESVQVESQATSYAPTRIVSQTVRSGTQIVAADGDLIILGSVSPGAEILAAGNIHVYGTLRGKALAGVKGDNSASIFCQNLQAELVSVAGVYLLSDDIKADTMGQAVRVTLEEDKLRITRLIQ